MHTFLSHLECSKTGNIYDANKLHNLSSAGAPLLARYDLKKAREHLKKSDLASRQAGMWRYKELLPVSKENYRISLGEGFTPLRKVDNLGRTLDFSDLYIKDESLNPTGSFKARGISVAVSMALECGASQLAIPSAGNAAGALAAYAAASGAEAFIFMPADTPPAFRLECDYYGAHVELVDGLISDCGDTVNRRKKKEGWFEISTLKEPYRLEGGKTMGFELAEQFDWKLPDVIIYPAGGGTGLIAMWKAFDELEQIGWIGSKRPRMVAVQAEGCAPIVRAFNHKQQEAESWQDAQTVASGLRVPGTIGDFLVLRALHETGGTAVAVSDEELIDYSRLMARQTGIFPAPEGGATLAALIKLKEQNLVDEDERVVLFNTGSGFKYMEVLSNFKKEIANVEY